MGLAQSNPSEAINNADNHEVRISPNSLWIDIDLALVFRREQPSSVLEECVCIYVYERTPKQ